MNSVSVMVLPSSQEQERALFAFLKALNIKYLSAQPNLEELEARLLPQQKEVWENLKVGLQWAKKQKSGEANDDILLTPEMFLADFDKDV